MLHFFLMLLQFSHNMSTSESISPTYFPSEIKRLLWSSFLGKNKLLLLTSCCNSCVVIGSGLGAVVTEFTKCCRIQHTASVSCVSESETVKTVSCFGERQMLALLSQK